MLLTITDELIKEVKIGGSLGLSYHDLVDFTLLRDVGQVKTKVRTHNFRRANFQLFKELVDSTPWKTGLKDKGDEKSWQIFKNTIIRPQELLIPSSKKSGQEGRRPA